MSHTYSAASLMTTVSAAKQNTSSSATSTVSKGERLLTAAMLIVVPTLFTGAFLLLSARFQYPEILRQPSEKVLMRFYSGMSQILPIWWAMLVAAVLFIPTALLTARALRLQNGALQMAVVLGTVAGLVQTLGIARWTFLVPYLAAQYAITPESDPARRTILLVFEAFHQYAGVGLGEWLGYLFTTGWTLLIANALLQQGSRLFGTVGIVTGLGILLGILEPFGIAWVGMVNAIAYFFWSLWMVGLGIRLARSSAPHSSPIGE